ncbi:hypothetical protein D3C85_667430 [compost metagenome]
MGKLHHEFDFADAAVAQLDVVCAVDAVARHGTALPVLTDAFAQRAQGGQRIEVKVLSIDERHAQAFQLAGLRAAVAAFERLRGHQARLQPGIAFPFATLADQVVFKRVQAPGQRAGVAVGAQPQVGAEYLAIGVHFRNHRHHAPRQPAVELVVADAARAIRFAFFAVQHDQVDVGRHVQLAAAQLAHADDQHFLRLAGGGVARHAVHRGQIGGHAAVCLRHRDVCQRGHCADHFFKVGLAGQVAHDQHAEHALAQFAQHHPARVQRQGGRRVGPGQFRLPLGHPGGSDGLLHGIRQPRGQIGMGVQAAAQVTGPGKSGGEQ